MDALVSIEKQTEKVTGETEVNTDRLPAGDYLSLPGRFYISRKRPVLNATAACTAQEDTQNA